MIKPHSSMNFECSSVLLFYPLGNTEKHLYFKSKIQLFSSSRFTSFSISLKLLLPLNPGRWIPHSHRTLLPPPCIPSYHQLLSYILESFSLKYARNKSAVTFKINEKLLQLTYCTYDYHWVFTSPLHQFCLFCNTGGFTLSYNFTLSYRPSLSFERVTH